MNIRPLTPATPSFNVHQFDESPDLPDIEATDHYSDLVRKLSRYIYAAIDSPHTFEQLRSTSFGHELTKLVTCLSDQVQHPAIVSALLIVKWHFVNLEPDDRGLNQSRGLAAEIVAWRFLTHLSERESIDYLLHALPDCSDKPDDSDDEEAGTAGVSRPSNSRRSESSPLLDRGMSLGVDRRSRGPGADDDGPMTANDRDDDPTAVFAGLNALEIAAVADAKKFLSQRAVQRIVNAIWKGEIIFWQSLGVHTKKKAQIYNERKADPYCRLRVPKYQKVFEVVFFASFLALYYAILIERDPQKITVVEVLLYIWIAAFAYDEFSEFKDAGSLFYAADFWSLWDLGIIGVGVAYLITRVAGLSKHSPQLTDTSFDILSLEALFLVPRICSLLSLHPYFGTLTKDFIKFLGIVIILYLGFLTTFTLLARDQFTLNDVSWILIKVFFGSSYLGFDAMREISPILGPPLMVSLRRKKRKLIFVCLTNILLITSLISLLSNSLTKNLLPLILLKPLRLLIPSDRMRTARITLLKATHFPFVAAIWAYEQGYGRLARRVRSLRYSSGAPLSSSRRPQFTKHHSLRFAQALTGNDTRSLGPGRTPPSRPQPPDAPKSPSSPGPLQHQHQSRHLPHPHQDPSRRHRSPSPTPAAVPADRESAVGTRGSHDEEDLRQLVKRLTLQVEGLTANMVEQTHDA
ncbi:MAG: hypothetical protein M1817_005498 [Caeruleum heppii]|nr:MAG: hypothetical protein M1817_005498 [Caeruleum heppii]